MIKNLEKTKKLIKEKLADGSLESYALTVGYRGEGGTDNRGLGFVHVNDRCYQACELFPDGSIGHEGYPGQSFFLCRERGLYVIFLSNAPRCTVKNTEKRIMSRFVTSEPNFTELSPRISDSL